MDIRLAKTEDLPIAIAIVTACVDHMNGHGIHQWDGIYPDRGTLERDISEQSLYLAVDQGICKAMIVLNDLQSAEYQAINWRFLAERILVVHRLAVDPAHQGQRIASRLMDFAEDFARDRRFGAIRLDAFVHNPAALRLYVNRGYHNAGIVHFRKGPFHCFEKRMA